jgi:peptidyl-prolyl cis-trans isomerase SurA
MRLNSKFSRMKHIAIILGFLTVFSVKGISQNSVDRVVAVVGSNMILFSEIETQYLQYSLQQPGSKTDLRCAIFEEMLLNKLMLHQAQVDSIEVTDKQVDSEMDRRLRYFIAQIGSEKKLEEYYKKSILQIKEEMRTHIREQMMIEQIERKITEDAKVTPSEVRSFFKAIPEDSIPLIGASYEILQIVKYPHITAEEKQMVKEKITALRDRAIKGDEFSVLARLYSEDPGTALKGGETGFFGPMQMVPEFEAAAFALKTPGEVSPVIETDFGYHIIQLIERRGDNINVRHILMQVKPLPTALFKAKETLDSILLLIKADSMSFEQAARRFSDDPSKTNGGMMVNPYSGTNRFQPDEIEPKFFFTIEKLKEGEISKPEVMVTEGNKQAYRIVMLRSKTSPHKANLKEDYNAIQELALKDKKEKLINEWIKKQSKETYIRLVDSDFKKCEFVYSWAYPSL